MAFKEIHQTPTAAAVLLAGELDLQADRDFLKHRTMKLLTKRIDKRPGLVVAAPQGR